MSVKKSLLEARIKKAIKQGYSEDEITNILVSLNFDKDLIKKVFEEINAEKELQKKWMVHIKEEDEFVYDKAKGHLTYETKLDDFLEFIQKKRVVRVKELASKFSIGPDDVIGWAKILQSKKLVKIKYPLWGEITILAMEK